MKLPEPFRSLSDFIDGLFDVPEASSKEENDIQPSNPPITDLETARQSLDLEPGTQTFRWAGLNLPVDEARHGFLAVGGTGSGKSTMIRSLMRSALPSIGNSSASSRALIFDPKRNWFSMLSNMGISCPVRTLNPFDERAVSWDMAADIQSPTEALRFANILLPDDESQPARTVIAGLIEFFIERSGRQWQLRDLVLAARSESFTKVLLMESSSTRHLVDKHLTDSEDLARVSKELESSLPPLTEIASGWNQATQSMSISSWFDQESILLLGSHPHATKLMNRLNAYFFSLIADQLLSPGEQEAKARGKTWLILDDLCECLPLEALHPLVVSSGSREVCLVLGVRSLKQLSDSYGEEAAHEILASLGHQLFLRADDPETATYSAAHFPSLNQQAFLDLPKPTPGATSSVTGFARSSALTKPYELTRYSEKTVVPDIYTRDFESRPFSPLSPWTESDLDRLGISHLGSKLIPTTSSGLTIKDLPKKYNEFLD